MMLAPPRIDAHEAVGQCSVEVDASGMPFRGSSGLGLGRVWIGWRREFDGSLESETPLQLGGVGEGGEPCVSCEYLVVGLGVQLAAAADA